jgi:hypothetical protein
MISDIQLLLICTPAAPHPAVTDLDHKSALITRTGMGDNNATLLERPRPIKIVSLSPYHNAALITKLP